VKRERERVLDASALLAFLHEEPGGQQVDLDGSVMSAVNWSEVFAKCLAYGIEVEGLRDELEALGLVIEPLDAQTAERAAELLSKTRSLGLSLGDRVCLALGERLGLPVVTADRTWRKVQIGVEIRLIR